MTCRQFVAERRQHIVNLTHKDKIMTFCNKNTLKYLQNGSHGV